MQDRLYIDGEWVRPDKGGTLAVINPATEEVIHKAPAGTSGDIDKAVKAARHAFDSGPGRASPAPSARVYLRAIADKIRPSKRELARLEVLDNGKPLPEAAVGHRRRRRLLRLSTPVSPRSSTAPEEPSRSPSRSRPRGPRAARRRRRHHSVELSAADGRLEGRARARGRLHHGAQALGADAAHGARAWRDRRGGRPAGRACSTSSPAPARGRRSR